MFCMVLPSFASAANQVSEITVEALLEADGSAYVQQVWTGVFDEGTECYFPVTNTVLDAWETEASFAYRYRHVIHQASKSAAAARSSGGGRSSSKRLRPQWRQTAKQ